MKNKSTIIGLLSLNIYRTLIGIIRSKIIAIKFSVAELGILGQLITFTNFQNQFVLFGTGAALNNLISKNEKENQNAIFSITFSILLFSNFIFLLFGLLFRHPLAFWLLKSSEYTDYISFVILIGPLYSLYRFFEISVQSRREFKLLVKGQSVIFTVAILTIIPLAYYWGISGIILNFAIWYLAGILYFFRKAAIQLSFHQISKNRKLIKKVLNVCFADLTRNLSIFAALIVFRIIIVQMLDLEDLGYFHAVWSLANYNNVLVQGFIVFLFPTLSHFAKRDDFSYIVNENLRRLLLIILPVLLILSFLPGLVLRILFSGEYTFLSGELRWLVFSKIFETIYLFYLIVFLAKDQFRLYFGLEILRSILFIIIPLFIVKTYGFNGAIAGIVFINIISFLFLIPFMFRLNLVMDKPSLLITIKSILGILIAFSLDQFEFSTFVNILLLIAVFSILFNVKKYISTLMEVYTDIKDSKSKSR